MGADLAEGGINDALTTPKGLWSSSKIAAEIAAAPAAAHDMGGSAHNPDSLANINTKISDATLDDSSSPRDPNPHDLAGAEHNADILADLNAKITDATLDDQDDPRPADQIMETGGPTTLDVGAVADGEFLRRSGSSVVGSGVAAGCVKGYFDGYKISNNATTPDEQIDIAAGCCRNDADDGHINYTGGTIDITASGANGLDTGTVAANTWYAIWAIYNPTTETAAGLFSASFSAPTMPSGYTKKRRIGVCLTDSTSDIYLFYQTGSGRTRFYSWDTNLANMNVLSGGGSVSFTTVDMSGAMPPSSTRCQLQAAFDAFATTTNQARLKTNGAAADPPIIHIQNETTDPQVVPPFDITTDNSQRIEYETDSGTDSLDLWVAGYYDEV